MANDQEQKPSAADLATLALSGLGAAAAAYVSPHVDAATNAALVAGATIGPPGMVRLVQSIFGRTRERWRDYFTAYAGAEASVDPGSAEQLFAEAADNEELRQLVIDSARVIAEALAGSAVPAMARLTRMYTSTHTAADGFFRGMRRALTDMTEGEFRDLRAILLVVDGIPEPVLWVELEIRQKSANGDLFLIRHSAALADGRFEKGGLEGGVDAPKSTSRLFQLLQVNRLAVPGTSRLGGTLPVSILAEVETLRRIKVVVE